MNDIRALLVASVSAWTRSARVITLFNAPTGGGQVHETFRPVDPAATHASLGPFPPAQLLDSDASVVIAERGRRLDVLPVQVNPSISTGTEHPWVGRDVAVNTASGIMRGRLVRVGVRGVLTLQVGDEYVQLQKYNALRTVVPDLHEPPNLLDIRLATPAVALHVHYEFLPRVVSWTPEYELFLDAALTRVQLFRAFARILNHTAFDLDLAGHLYLKAFATPSSSLADRTVARIQSHTHSKHNDDDSSQAVATFRLRNGPAVLHAQQQCLVRLFAAHDLPLQNQYVANLDLHSSSSASVRPMRPTRWTLRLRNSSRYAWPSGIARVRIVSAKRGREVSLVGKAVQVPLTAPNGSTILDIGNTSAVTHESRVATVLQHDQDVKTGSTVDRHVMVITTFLRSTRSNPVHTQLRVRLLPTAVVESTRGSVVEFSSMHPSSLADAEAMPARAESLPVAINNVGRLTASVSTLPALVRLDVTLRVTAAAAANGYGK